MVEESMDQEQLHELRELVEFLKLHGVGEFDMERPDLKVRIKFAGGDAGPFAAGGLSNAGASTMPAHVAAFIPAGAVDATAPVVAAPAAAPEPKEKLHEVKSPIVGTFYDAPAPGSDAFVKIGDTVEVGQVLCIVEAMKLMNEIEADTAGEIVQRIAVAGQPVEYGQPLFAIRPR